MPLYMDRHDPVPGLSLTPDDFEQAHRRDLEVQERYGARYLTALVDIQRQTGFCLVEAPSAAVAEAVHREAHGNIASRIIEVDPIVAQAFLGIVDHGDASGLHYGPGVRIILFTDIEGSTDLMDRLGDDAAVALIRTHDELVRRAVSGCAGREVKHTGDGIMACFASAAQATRCAASIQRELASHNATADHPIRVRIGLSAGEPVTTDDDLFGIAVNAAARICAAATPGTVLAAGAVRDLTTGKNFEWVPRGSQELRGLREPIQLFELRWENEPTGEGAI